MVPVIASQYVADFAELDRMVQASVDARAFDAAVVASLAQDNGSSLLGGDEDDRFRELDALNGCYANSLISPEKCEIDFVAKPWSGDEIQRLGSTIDSWSFGLGLSEIATSLVAARLAREGASWVGILSPSLGVGSISINFGVLGQAMASLNAFNDALYKARLQKSCTLWVGAWDQAHCQ